MSYGHLLLLKTLPSHGFPSCPQSCYLGSFGDVPSPRYKGYTSGSGLPSSRSQDLTSHRQLRLHTSSRWSLLGGHQWAEAWSPLCPLGERKLAGFLSPPRTSDLHCLPFSALSSPCARGSLLAPLPAPPAGPCSTQGPRHSHRLLKRLLGTHESCWLPLPSCSGCDSLSSSSQISTVLFCWPARLLSPPQVSCLVLVGGPLDAGILSYAMKVLVPSP